MQNPVEIERRYQEVVARLQDIASLRLRWTLITDFLSSVSHDFERYDTYIIQLVPLFPVFEHPLSYMGTDPEKLITAVDLLTDCEQKVTELTQDEHYIRARNALIQSVFVLLAITGEFVRLIELQDRLSEEQKTKELAWVKEIQEKEKWDNLQKIGELAKVARKKGRNELSKRLKRIHGEGYELTEGVPGSVYIPVVEREQEAGDETMGRLRRLTASVSGHTENESDCFSNDFAVAGAEKSVSKETQSIAEVVRKQLRKTHSHLSNLFFDVLIAYEMRRGWQSGASSEMGAALASYCGILDFCGEREQYSVNRNLAITAKLGQDGRAGLVDAEGIKNKVAAVFFSWVNTLVVPQKQQRAFKKHLSELRQKYPHRDEITLIGVDHFSELFYDRRVTEHNIESRSRYYLRRAWQKKFSVAGALIIFILLLLVAWFVYGPIDKNPVSGVFKGEHLFVENQYGQTIVQLDAGYRSDFDAERASEEGTSPQVQFVDINGDNVNEIIWATNMSRSGEEIEYFKCWSVTGDSLVWQRPALFDLNFPRKSGMVDNHFFIGELRRANLNDRKTYIISRLAMREMFPGLVILLDPSTGMVESKYIHAGQVNGLELVDINGDGISEVLISGINNAFATAFAAALNLQNIGGHSPVRGDYEIEGAEQADELHYLLIPKTKVGQYLDPIERYNRSGEINFAKEDSLISVWVRDGQAHAFEGIQRNLRIIAHFDFDFIPQGFSTSDQYDIVAEELYEEGEIESIPDYDYFEAFKDSILYWNGEQFILSKNRDF